MTWYMAARAVVVRNGVGGSKELENRQKMDATRPPKRTKKALYPASTPVRTDR